MSRRNLQEDLHKQFEKILSKVSKYQLPFQVESLAPTPSWIGLLGFDCADSLLELFGLN
uniref:Uncharacterized protein n=1 Tax=Rhizophagus irregularis (strain DAOM 181602 / DAOM 197198 / MUCL 43194) TaxID=747089 RepID=U9SSM8_RHIID